MKVLAKHCLVLHKQKKRLFNTNQSWISTYNKSWVRKGHLKNILIISWGLTFTSTSILGSTLIKEVWICLDMLFGMCETSKPFINLLIITLQCVFVQSCAGKVKKYPPMENWPWVEIKKQDDEFICCNLKVTQLWV